MYITYNAFVLKYFLHIHVCHSVVFTYPNILTQEMREEEKWDVFQEQGRRGGWGYKKSPGQRVFFCFYTKGAPIVFFLFYIYYKPHFTFFLAQIAKFLKWLTGIKPRKHKIGDLIGKTEAMNGKIN